MNETINTLITHEVIYDPPTPRMICHWLARSLPPSENYPPAAAPPLPSSFACPLPQKKPPCLGGATEVVDSEASSLNHSVLPTLPLTCVQGSMLITFFRP